MIAGEATIDIRRPARECCEFVLDLERYRRADTKIRAVHSVTWKGEDHAEVQYGGRFRGLNTPLVRQSVDVQRYRRIEVRSIPGTLAHAASRFLGVFTFEELGGGVTRVYHREEIDVRPPLRWIVEPFLREWLANDTPVELVRMKRMLEEA